MRNYEKIVNPLYRLLQKNVKWQWGEEEQKAFVSAKSERTLRVTVSPHVKLYYRKVPSVILNKYGSTAHIHYKNLYIKTLDTLPLLLPRLIFCIIFSQVGQIKLSILCYYQPARLVTYFRIPGIYLTRPTAKETRNGDPAQNNMVYLVGIG